MQWCVKVHEIEVLPHPNADTLELGNVGGYQVVIPKGKYNTGDHVLFLPEKTIIPQGDQYAWADSFRPYLSNGERVKSIRLRGELSQGIILDYRELLGTLPLAYQEVEDMPQLLEEDGAVKTVGILHTEQNVDWEKTLGVFQYVPSGSQAYKMRGNWTRPPKEYVPPQGVYAIEHSVFSRHECPHFNLLASNFTEGERVIVTEKIHGSQIAMIRFADGSCGVSSKGVFAKGYLIEEDADNFYWQCARNTGIFDLLAEAYPGIDVQAFGEAYPCQKGYHYGADTPTLRLFDVRINGESLPFDSTPPTLRALWTTVLYDGPYSKDAVRAFAVGKEQISGKEYHIREGVVVRPDPMRFAEKGGARLHLKIINPAYKESGEEIS